MQSEKITPDNVAGLEWDEEHFKYCTFSGLEMEGHTICSDFVGCIFENVYWYWGLFTETNFIDCRFNECTFAGTGFPASRFIDCKLTNCNFIADNLAAPCSFGGAVAYGCSVVNSPGFDIPNPQNAATEPINLN
jgi:uncharacterized protein YjbI with pentapeptide repeats